MRRSVLILLAACLSAQAFATAETPLAWIRFNRPEQQEYEGVRYLFLGDQSLYVSIDVCPSEAHSLDLLWGSKGDLRGAELIVNESTHQIQAGKYKGFRWQRIKLPQGIAGERYELQLRPNQLKAGFVAAIRLVQSDAPLDQALPQEDSHAMRLSDAPPHPLDAWMAQLQNEDLDVWTRARIHGDQSNEALRRCRKYVDGWLAHADPISGLIPRNLKQSKHLWNGRDSAADNYAFMVLTCALTDRELYRGRMTDMLRSETKLTSRVGALPADYDFGKQGLAHEDADIDRLIFDGSEYVKDGLMPITEWLGPTKWSQRMLSIVDSIVEHAPFQTDRGPIPSNSVEVNGEMMQVLSRLCFMTGDEQYLDAACRIADYYLLGDQHPTRNATTLGLRDHNCELISGLTEVYAACHAIRASKIPAYRQPIHWMLDDILAVGVNEHGLMYDSVNPRTGQILSDRISDNWGYNYNGFYTVYLLDGVDRYRDATRKALANLKPHYWKFAWQGWGSDGIADSVEGAINLHNREFNIAGVSEWIDANVSRMLLLQKPDGVIEGWHGDGNYARTAIMWALMKQQGVTLQPWRADVKLGAVLAADTLYLAISVDQAWQGRLVFDQPRHQTVMHLPLDYPRINQFPEWFTADPQGNSRYQLSDSVNQRQTYSGRELAAGLPIKLATGETRRFRVSRP